jgi:hypothetical protein
MASRKRFPKAPKGRCVVRKTKYKGLKYLVCDKKVVGEVQGYSDTGSSRWVDKWCLLSRDARLSDTCRAKLAQIVRYANATHPSAWAHRKRR